MLECGRAIFQPITGPPFFQNVHEADFSHRDVVQPTGQGRQVPAVCLPGRSRQAAGKDSHGSDQGGGSATGELRATFLPKTLSGFFS